jgi:tetratricopeptide (TPR) repeat protein
MGRHDEGLRVVTTALAVDPLSLGLHLTLGRCLYLARRFEEALAKSRAILEAEPLHVPAYWEIGRAYEAMHRYSESVPIVEQGMRLAGRLPPLLMYAGAAYAGLGERGRALDVAKELRRMSGQRYLSPTYEAHVRIALGDFDEGFRLYDEAYERRSGWLMFTRAAATWDPVREDPRYLALLKRLKLDF